ncbi:uncharacterized protein [Arachis hypogaea]|uniref:uncharacterized protein n=1 Tax=Arachis hypogaea TaxID=3818 RepID=UPI003B21BA39
MGFGSRWRSWVMECVTTASMSFLINDSPSKPFKMGKGLRQGDLLSPFLFVLVVDVLHRMVGETIRNMRIFSLMVGRDRVELSHLQFIDDTILFCPSEDETMKNYKRLLRWFELMFGLSTLPMRYLRVPLGANPRLLKTWKPVIDKRRFLWSKEDGKNGMALVRWDLVQAPEKLGRLGVGDAMLRNTVLLFKWWWRFAQEECPLWKKMVYSCNKLKPNELLSTQVLPTKGGPWKDICQIQIKDQNIRDKMITGMSMEIGDGHRTRFWEDMWLHCGSLKDRFSRLFSVSSQCDSVIQEGVLPEDITSYNFTKSIWKGLVPPRVELFAWFVLTGRVNTKERLTRLGILNQDDKSCVLCNKDVEQVHHLFLGCDFTWQVWNAWISVFGRLWSLPGSMKDHFLSWTEELRRKEDRKQRLRCFCAIIWNIWMKGNKRIF